MFGKIQQINNKVFSGEREIGYIDNLGFLCITFCGAIPPKVLKTLSKKYQIKGA